MKILRIHKLLPHLLANGYHLLHRRRFYIALAILMQAPAYLKAQEKLHALTQNARLQNVDQPKEGKLKSITAQSLQLPVIDDFSSTNIFPDSRIWADKNVFINNSFAINPKTIGVATFDIFDAQGKIYKIAQSTGFGADTLTSNPINLNYIPESNIYLSFYYQPGGLGDVPDTKDSLILQFYSPVKSKWDTIWKTPGFDSPSTFTYKSIPITDPNYLADGFRFRFINYASLTTTDIIGKTSIPDVWNLDYVKLDINRTPEDTLYQDVALTQPMSSLLKTYNSMPWSHYLFAFIKEIKPTIGLSFKIYDPKSRTVDRKFSFKELNTTNPTDLLDIRPVAYNPWETNVIETDLTNPFTSRNKDSAIYEVRSFIGCEDVDITNRYNDTSKFIQVFNNYFAYDDGTAESSYGISGQGTTNAMAAYGFYSYFPDTLRSIAILFSPSQDNASDSIYFRLSVWDNNKGKPGNLIYRDQIERQTLTKGRNEFVYYSLDSGILVNETFFIGWEQSSEDFLNIGYDLNCTNGQRFLFYNIAGTWIQSGSSGNVRPGSLMFRPVMRTKKSTPLSNPVIKENIGISVYPNPAIDNITLSEMEDSNDQIIRITIFNLLGQSVKAIDHPGENIDISELKPGLYILKFQTIKGKSETIKLLKEM